MSKTIIQINSVANTGSTGRIAEKLGLLAISEGWESYIAYGRDFNSSKSNLIKIGNTSSIYAHILQTRIFDTHGLGSKKATEVLVQQIEKLNPDVIHIHNLHGYYLNINILFNYLYKKPVPIVWTLHDCWPLTGHCTHFTYVKCDKWKKLCNNCPQTKQYPTSRLFDNSTQNYELKKALFNTPANITFVPVSNWLNSILKDSFLSSHPSKVINNGVDLDVFTPKKDSVTLEKYGLKDNFIILGVSGIWTKGKGLQDFFELSKRLDSDKKIILVGLKKSQLKNIPKNIVGIEKTENVEELAELYSLADVFINPTYADSFPTTNLESLACGTPVITYETDGSPESITPSTGIVVKQGSVDGLIQAINIIKLKGKINYSDACVTRAKKYYNKNEKFKEYIDLYKKLLNI